MDEIKACKLPGFYTDERGVYGIVIGAVYIYCFRNDYTGLYEVATDTVDSDEDFALNLELERFYNPEQAIECLRTFVKTYARRYFK